MNEGKFKNITEALGAGLVNAMYVFPLALAFGFYSGFGAEAGLVSALIATAFIPTVSGKGEYIYLCSCPLFLIANDIFLRHGKAAALLAFVCSGVFLLILSFFGKRPYELARKIPAGITSGLSLGFFVIMFFKQVTNYFEIGATGSTPFEIFKNYAFVGFHANWRTVLYSTIMLVVLITYPFKFKKASKIVSPAFLGVIITTALNFLLNPDVAETDIPELGALNFSFSGIDVSAPFSVFAAISGGLAIAAFVILSRAALPEEPGRLETAALGAANIIAPFFGAVPATAAKENKNGRVFFTGTVSCLFIIMFLTAFRVPIQRIPTSPLATVLVITAWLDINWKAVGDCFRGGILPVVFLIAAAGCAFFFDLILVIPLAVIFGLAIAASKSKRRIES